MHSDCALRTNKFPVQYLVYSKKPVLYAGRWLLSCDECHSWLSCVGTTALVLQANPGEWALLPVMAIQWTHAWMYECKRLNSCIDKSVSLLLMGMWVNYRRQKIFFFLPSDCQEIINMLFKKQDCIILDEMHYQTHGGLLLCMFWRLSIFKLHVFHDI